MYLSNKNYYFMHFMCMIIILSKKGTYLKNFGAHVKNKHV
jgi:hypothetical protein